MDFWLKQRRGAASRSSCGSLRTAPTRR